MNEFNNEFNLKKVFKLERQRGMFLYDNFII